MEVNIFAISISLFGEVNQVCFPKGLCWLHLMWFKTSFFFTSLISYLCYYINSIFFFYFINSILEGVYCNNTEQALSEHWWHGQNRASGHTEESGRHVRCGAADTACRTHRQSWQPGHQFLDTVSPQGQPKDILNKFILLLLSISNACPSLWMEFFYCHGPKGHFKTWIYAYFKIKW